MACPANHLTDAKTRFKGNQTAAELQHTNLHDSHKKQHVHKQNY